jgi:hypothetical protein
VKRRAGSSATLSTAEAYRLIAVRYGLESTGWAQFQRDCGRHRRYRASDVWAWLTHVPADAA